MNRVTNKRQAARTILWLLVIGIMISLWPLRLVKETVVSDTHRQIEEVSEAVTTDYVVKQMFIAQYDRLKDIRIYFAGGEVGEEFNFVLYDASMNILMQQVISTEDMKQIPGDCRVQVNIDTEVGREYYFLVQGMEKPFYVAYENTEASGNIYNGTVYYGNVEDTERYMIAAYDYEVPLRKGKTFAAELMLLIAGLFFDRVIVWYYRRWQERNRLVTVLQVCRAVLVPLIIAGGIAGVLTVWPLMLYTRERGSVIFFSLGILLTAVLLLYAVCHDRTGIATTRSVSEVCREKWQDYLQSAMIAGAIWGCCNYMNGLYEIHHSVAYRQVLIFLALSVIVTYKKEELFCLCNLIWAAVSALIGYRYYSTAAAALENPEELELQVLTLTAWLIFLTGIVVIHALSLLIHRRIRGLSVWYGILVAVFFVLLIIYRNLRGWPIYLVCAFTLFYLCMAGWDKKSHLLQNTGNGILLHFCVMVGYCLLHRPYMFYQYYRYPFFFHTVTISAVYLAMVVCAALIKLMDAYRRNPRLSGYYKELFLFGTAGVYLLLTLSRTGYLAILLTALLAVPLCCFSMKGGFRALLRITGAMLLSVLLCFPVVFTAQRILPSVAAEPELHEIEELPTELVHGRVTDSYYYITFERFVQVFQMKVLGIPEEKCVHAGNWAFREEELKDTWFQKERIYLASAEDMGSAGEPAEEEESYANGRLEIFRIYYDRLNMTGHEDMGIMLPDGNFIVHAHNIYLQAAYDHGLLVGAVFVLFGAGTLVQSLIFYHRKKEMLAFAALPFAMLLLFAVAGLTEWIFHPCCPIACCLLMMLAPLLCDCRKEA